MLTLIRCPFHPRVTAVARKRPRSFCQKCRWYVTPKHAYTFDPTKSEWADYAAVQAYCGNLCGNELTHSSSGNTRSQLSLLAEPLWTDPGPKSGISVRELISTFKKKKKKTQAGNDLPNILPKSSHTMMVVLTELYPFMLVSVTLVVFQGHKRQTVSTESFVLIDQVATLYDC